MPARRGESPRLLRLQEAASLWLPGPSPAYSPPERGGLQLTLRLPVSISAPPTSGTLLAVRAMCRRVSIPGTWHEARVSGRRQGVLLNGTEDTD